MRRHLFWLVTAAVLGIACHVAYLLFAPSRTFGGAIDRALGAEAGNSFVVLEPKAHLALMPFVAANHVVGVCKYNLSNGPVKVSARLPEGFWSFAVYTIRGQQVYAINDLQADTNAFSVELYLSSGVLSQIFSSGEDLPDISGDDLGWRISVAEKQGLAILTMPVADALLRPEIVAVIKQSRCAPLAQQ
jgi:uncharacterized membrane protein